MALAGTVTANEREDDVAAEAPAADSDDAPEQDEASSSEAEEEDGADTVKPLELLGKTVQPGTFETLHWAPDQSFRSIATPVPVLVAHGNEPGPRLCLTAAVHGDELNGIEMVRRLMY
ncbi:MAG TPA: succinylglutamate desuccinylase, partial [Alcanivorax sp.]|nr:succinylglutamate desuccinylase [Alcanivorax sp.]